MAYQSEIEKLEQRYHENPQQWFAALADSYRKAGNLDLAVEVVRGGLEKRPNYASGHIVLGRCLLDMQKTLEAAAAFQQVLELDGENIIALKSLGEIAEQQGDIPGAKDWLSQLLEVDPMNDEARDNLERLSEIAIESPEDAEILQEQPSGTGCGRGRGDSGRGSNTGVPWRGGRGRGDCPSIFGGDAGRRSEHRKNILGRP
jgi:tetratricopeptide (TPR) repeat protein